MAVRAIRGATRLEADDRDEMNAAVAELLTEIMTHNRLEGPDLISILFTATPDVTCGFPAAVARGIGLTDVPLMCAQELDIDGAMPLVIRVMVHTWTDFPRRDLRHPYLRGTESLRSPVGSD